MRVLFAPNAFKGSLTAATAADVMARSWRAVRPGDDLSTVPMADGGDGTASVLAGVLPGAHWVSAPSVDAIGAPIHARYLMSDRTAVIELAEICGLALLDEPHPMHAHTIGLGIVIATAMRAGADRILIAPAGSASTDGGAGALSALGARLVGHDGLLPVGGAGLAGLDQVDRRRLCRPPAGGVEVLVDVTAPLFGPDGAAEQFGPQKGADPDQVAALDRGLRRFAEVLGGDPQASGSGAAGGLGYGLAQWGATLRPGAEVISELVGLPDAVSTADLVVTGEGRLDETSLIGKVPGLIVDLAGDRARIIAGSVSSALKSESVVALDELAGSVNAARGEPERWLAEGTGALARAVTQS